MSTAEGVPALFFKFGYTLGSDEHKLFKQWLTEHYHAPSDDLSQQPVDRVGAARFIAFLTAMTRAVADAPERPRWNDDSFFRRQLGRVGHVLELAAATLPEQGATRFDAVR